MQFGNLSGLVNGTEQIVFDHEVTGSAVSSVSSGSVFNGDEDCWYTIILFGVRAADGNFGVRFNNDTGSNYGHRGIIGTSTTIGDDSGSGTTYANLGNSGGAGTSTFCVARLHAKSGVIRLMERTWGYTLSGTTVTGAGVSGVVWNNTADNITSMEFMHTGSTAIGVGTRIIVLKSNNFTGGTPTGAITSPYIKGAWVRLDSQVLSGAGSSVTFSGLDGDRDVVYFLSVMGKASGGTTSDRIRFNSDTGTNYGYQYLDGTNTTTGASRGTSQAQIPGGAASVGNYSTAVMVLFAKSGFIRPGVVEALTTLNGTSISSETVYGTIWNNTADNITSIEVSTASNNYAIGSQFELYALRPGG